MIHLDTGYLISALRRGSAEDQRLREWLAQSQPIRIIVKFLNEHLSTVERARRAAEQELAAVLALPAALLRRAFSGEL